MKILLLQDVRKLGKKYDIKEVSDGYARNFLIARKLAMPADAKAMNLKSRHEADELESEREDREEAKRLEAEVLEFTVKTGAKGEVFGSVTAQQIGEALKEKGYHGAGVNLEKPLKNLGDTGVEISFSKGISGRVKVRLLS